MRVAALSALMLAGATSGAILGFGLAGAAGCGAGLTVNADGSSTGSYACRFEPQAGMFAVASLPILLTGLAATRRWVALGALMGLLAMGSLATWFPGARAISLVVFFACSVAALSWLRKTVARRLSSSLPRAESA